MAQKRLGPYLVGKTIGKGGFSVVKAGVHEETGTQVALKLLEKTKIGASSEKQVQRELDAMLRLQHPNIIRLFTADWNVKYPKQNGKTEDKLLIVLEFAEGGELFEYLAATGPFEEAVARTYFHQLISGGPCSRKRRCASRFEA